MRYIIIYKNKRVKKDKSTWVVGKLRNISAFVKNFLTFQKCNLQNMEQYGGWQSVRKSVDKSLLKNIIRHTDAHNKVMFPYRPYFLNETCIYLTVRPCL